MDKTEFNAEHADASFPGADRVLRQALAAHAFPCCAYGVVAGGRVLASDALGHFTWESKAAEPSIDTRFDIASLTKAVATNAAAMLLHQRGHLDLELPLIELLPEFASARSMTDPGRGIRMHHLLAHNSGLPAYVEFFRTASNADALWHALLQTPLRAAPGAQAEYSDLGFLLLGRALERLTGAALDVWCRQEIFAPLGMDATGFCPRLEERAGIPPTEIDARDGRRIQGEVQDENARLLGGVAGHAGLFSNIPDLLRFATAILKPDQSGLFAPNTIDRFARRQAPEGSSRALGWDTPSENSSSGHSFSPRSVGHLGFSGCSLWIDLDAELAVVLLSNRTWPDRENQAIRQVRPAFHDAVRAALADK